MISAHVVAAAASKRGAGAQDAPSGDSSLGLGLASRQDIPNFRGPAGAQGCEVGRLERGLAAGSHAHPVPCVRKGPGFSWEGGAELPGEPHLLEPQPVGVG